MNRRTLLKSLMLAAAGAGLSSGRALDAHAEEVKTPKIPMIRKAADFKGSFISANDGTPLFYRDWGAGKPMVFLSSWAMNSDMWQYQITPMLSAGFRCVAYDRRGHGRSGQPAHGYDYDTLADDLAAVAESLDLQRMVLVGHSMAPGEIVRYLTRHGAARVERIVMLAPTTPFILKTADNPGGVARAVFDQVRALWLKDYPKWLADNARGFVIPETSPALINWAMSLMMQPPLKVLLDCNDSIIETDFRGELPKVGVPTLIIHGDKDLSAPLELTGRRTAALISGAQIKIYEGAPHGLMFTHIERLNHDLIEFARG
jgi:non-heme chloroperoxidase